ncbi:membrane protein, putative [Babesia bigemina]|uniref:very-long-chain (3R)-3-hydroxyacyl-CoA dehydratase n=1 Tax=Babesia bigemina TaxID=5866 RepID=A0A061D867_BABBI|nr:membrane protein, putative [Babesia bigemina]CDR96871.1 membrane protein, putative [Babesia bigemina]|eukprot:XP_012769057.1 membrane protein, putative [Babesia bigemina]
MTNLDIPRRAGWYSRLIVLHYVSSLCVWVSVELLLLTFLLRHEEGHWPTWESLSRLSPVAFWTYIRPLFQCGLVAQCLMHVYTFLDGACCGASLYLNLEQCVRTFAVYFVAIPLLKEVVPMRSVLLPVSALTLMNILSCLDALYTVRGTCHTVLEWLSHKVVLVLYPLLAFEEIWLVRQAARVVRNVPIARDFPSPMPNAYNFAIDTYYMYSALPLVMLPCSVLYYCYQVRYRRLARRANSV